VKQSNVNEQNRGENMQGGGSCLRKIVALVLIVIAFLLGLYGGDEKEIKEETYSHDQEQIIDIAPKASSKHKRWICDVRYLSIKSRETRIPSYTVSALACLNNKTAKDEKISSISMLFYGGDGLIYSRFVDMTANKQTEREYRLRRYDTVIIPVEMGPFDLWNTVLLLNGEMKLIVQTTTAPYESRTSTND